MNCNDVKMNMVVELFDGTRATVLDNKKGQIRMIRVPMYGPLGAFDTGSGYVKDWHLVQTATGQWEEVTMTPAQAKQAKAIAAGMALYGF